MLTEACGAKPHREPWLDCTLLATDLPANLETRLANVMKTVVSPVDHREWCRQGRKGQATRRFLEHAVRDDFQKHPSLSGSCFSTRSQVGRLENFHDPDLRATTLRRVWSDCLKVGISCSSWQATRYAWCKALMQLVEAFLIQRGRTHPEQHPAVLASVPPRPVAKSTSWLLNAFICCWQLFLCGVGLCNI